MGVCCRGSLRVLQRKFACVAEEVCVCAHDERWVCAED